MDWKIRCLSTASSWTIRAFPSRSASPAFRRSLAPPTLVIRQSPRRETERVVERRTVLQTVVHNHITQTVCPPLREGRDTVLRLLSPPDGVREDEARARPTLAARRLVRLFSAESAKRELERFFQGVARAVIQDERRQLLRHPQRGVSLVYHLWREGAIRETVERLSRETWERAGAPVASPPEPAPAPERRGQAESGAEFQALLRGLERSLEHRGRLEALRQRRR